MKKDNENSQQKPDGSSPINKNIKSESEPDTKDILKSVMEWFNNIDDYFPSGR